MVFKLREWIVEKLSPIQPSIAAETFQASPEFIGDWQTAYQDIDIIHRSIEIILNGLCEVPYSIAGGPQKKIHKLLNVRPNPFEDTVRFYRRLYLDFFLDGNSFIFHDRNEKGDAFHVLPANKVTVVPDSRTFVKQYEYQAVAGFRSSTSGKIVFQPNDIIHVKNDSDDGIYRGDSRLKSLDRLIELYYAMIGFQRMFFKNNAVPGVVLKTSNVLSKKIKDRLLKDWQNSYGNLFNGARSPAILDGGLEIAPFSTVSFTELDFEASIERIQEDMAKSLGVPYVLLRSGNNANTGNNQKLFYLHTILPILQQFASAFSHHFGPTVEITPHRDSIRALRRDVDSPSNYYSTLVNGGIITPNEARAGLGFDRMEGEDAIRVPQNIAGSAVDPSQGGRPEDEES